MAEIHTYPEMNEKIVGILRISDDPACLYAAQYIEELQKPVEERAKEYLRVKGRCPTCKRSSDVLNDGTTNCPIEKCYALPLDGYCHLYEPRKAEESE